MLVGWLVTLSVLLFVASIAQLSPLRRAAVRRRLSELQRYDPAAGPQRRTTIAASVREQIIELLHRLGGRATPHETVQAQLMRAGFRHPQMVAIYRGGSIVTAALGAAACLALYSLSSASAQVGALVTVYGAIVGYLAPRWYVKYRVSSRQNELRRALPDALDLLVVCVEAGLGLNQALRRVAQEIGLVSPALELELTTVNLEIRAGAARLDALKSLGERTGLDDLRSLAATLIQTEKFGTPVADALRAHAEALRTSRRQRAEEAAAKTTIKLLFPLVLFIFPPLYVVILGPAVLMMLHSMAGK